MAGPFDTQIGIGVKDNATPAITRIRNEVTRMQEARERLGVRSEHAIRREIQQTEASYNRLARNGAVSAAELTRAYEKATARINRLRSEMAEAEMRSYNSRNTAREAYTALGIRSEQSIQREIQRTTAAYNRLERSGTLSATALTRAHEKMTSTIAKLEQELGKVEEQSYTRRNAAREAYELLGVRSEHAIQREIQRTTAAYNRLERSGVLSATEQKRAYEQMTTTVGKLRRELGEAERTQSRVVSTFKTIGGIAAGVSGAAMVLGRPIGQQRDFDSELHQGVNFLYRDKNSASERLAGVSTLRSKIYDAVEYGGGDRKDALAAAEIMGRSKMGRNDVYGALPEVMKVSTATGADASDVASLMTSTFNFGFSGPQANAALDAATTASQHGKADVSLLAREAPRGLENAKSAGFAGQKGFADVLALYEIAASVAGSADEGATNANDLLAEMSSVNLANSTSRVKINGKKLDFKSMAVKDAQRGHNSLYTLERIVQSVDRNDPQMKALHKKLSAATDPDARKNLQSAIDERHGQNLGLFLHNQQSRNAFMGYERNPEQFEATSHDIEEQFNRKPGERSTDVDYAVMKDTAAFKSQMRKTEQEKASDAAVKPVSDALGNFELKVAELAEEFPKVAVAAERAAIALSMVAAFGALKGGTDLLTGGGKGGGLLGRLRGNPGAVVEAGEDAAGVVGGKPGWISRAASVGGRYGGKLFSGLGWLGEKLSPIGDAIMGAEAFYSEHIQRGKDKVKENGGKVPSYMPQPVGALDVWDEIANWLNSSSTNKPQPKTSQSSGSHQQLSPVSVFVTLDGQQIAATVETRIGQNARRHGA